MAFNFKLMFKMLFKTFWRTRGTNAQLTPKRMLIILIVFPLYVLIELSNWIGFTLDAIIFPQYRHQEVRNPLFIVGLHRSGTTFLHRVMAKDQTQFTAMKFWEILFAPSIIQKNFFNALGAADKFLRSPAAKTIRRIEKRLFSRLNIMHKTGLFYDEEDAVLLLHIFASPFLLLMFPFIEDFWSYVCFDLELTTHEKKKIMSFYKRCVQKHLYVYGHNKRFLSKNPLFSSMVQSLNETFPDAQFIYTVRTPFEGVPSSFSIFSFWLHVFLSPREPYPLFDNLLLMISHFYRHPLNTFDVLAPERWHVIIYDTLVKNPAQTIAAIYSHFHIDMTAQYRQMVQSEAERARTYKSNHEYSLAQLGLSRGAMVAQYEDIFERFGFEKV